MPDITVRRHGGRWAVEAAGDASATKEFETREAAELAARDLADGGRVQVVEEDTSGVGRDEDRGLDPRDEVTQDDVKGTSAQERTRSNQPGL
jgi:hypothetical protein